MVKISIEDFTNQAIKNGKFDIQWTVAKVRAWRKANNKKEENNKQDAKDHEHTKTEKYISQGGGEGNDDIPKDMTDDSIIDMESWEVEPEENIISIALPDSLEKIKLLINILNNHPWTDHRVVVQNKEYHISAQGMILLQSIT